MKEQDKSDLMKTIEDTREVYFNVGWDAFVNEVEKLCNFVDKKYKDLIYMLIHLYSLGYTVSKRDDFDNGLCRKIRYNSTELLLYILEEIKRENEIYKSI